MISAYEEFMGKLESYKKDKNNVKCAHIECRDKDIILKVDFTDEEYEQFLKDLDFKYDAGYGYQELYGMVWFKDNSWLERYEYDGSEGWRYKKYPEIDKVCFRD